MISNYIKIALRNLVRFKAYSAINITGLAIGMACCILILLYVFDELSYDRFHENSDRIYRIYVNGALGDNTFTAAVSPPPMRNVLLQDYPEVEAATRFNSFGFPVLRYGDKVFSEEKFYWVDSTFFDVFTVEFVKGNPKTALNRPETVILTEKMAKKYFGNEDPVGKLLNADNRRDYKVTGVVKEFPENSHLHFDFLASMSSYAFVDQQGWLNNNFYTYLLLRKGASEKEFEAKLPGMVEKYVKPVIENFLNTSWDDLKKSGATYEFILQRVTDIHLNSNLVAEIEPNSDITYIYIFSLIAGGILLIACINFTNLATARSANRLKEIGVRKTLGSSRNQLIKQFLTESIMMTTIAVFLSLIVIEIALPFFGKLVDKDLSVNYFSNIYAIPLLVLFIIFVGILAGAYPALYLSSFNPAKVLKKETGQSGRNPWLRNALVVLQFAVSITLFIGTIIVYNQLEYISNKKLGFNKDQVVVVKKTDDIGIRRDRIMERFVNDLKSLPGVIDASNSNTIFGSGNFGNTPYKVYGANENHLMTIMFADENYASVYGIEMLKGRYYSKEFGTDTSSLVINESAAKEFGIEDDPIGKQIVQAHGSDQVPYVFTVIGVMKDFHYQSLHEKIQPMLIHLYFPNGFGRNVSVKVSAAGIKNNLEEIENVWHKYAGNQAFEYVFFDEEFAKAYEAERRTSVIVTVFSVLAILIACLGLLGLAAFTTEQRTKEVGIRKILGASVPGIVVLLLKDFAKWVLISNIIAWPIAYFALNKWLEDFAYRIDISLWVFILASISAMLIAIFTVSYQSIKAATANPVKSLRYE